MKEHYWYTETEFANYPTCELKWEPEYDCYSLDSKHLKAVWEFCFAENKEDVIPLLKKFVNEHPDFWDELKKGGYEETTIEDIFALDDKDRDEHIDYLMSEWMAGDKDFIDACNEFFDGYETFYGVLFYKK